MSDLVVPFVGDTTPTTPVVVTLSVATYIEECKYYLYTNSRDLRNRLVDPLDAAQVTFKLKYTNSMPHPSDLVSIGLEKMYVWGISGDTVTVDRAQFGTSSYSHDVAETVTVNPKFADFDIFREMNGDIADLSSLGLFRARTVELTYNPSLAGYNLTGVVDIDAVLEVRVETVGPTHEWPVVTSYSLARNMAAGDFASTYALFFHDSAWPGRRIRVTYRAPLGLFTALTDDVLTATGLPSTAIDLPKIGAAIRLAAPRELKRNFDEDQGETRRAEEVPAGANLNAAGGLRAMRASRLSAELERQHRRYPLRRHRMAV